MIQLSDISKWAESLVGFTNSELGIKVPVELAYLFIGTPVLILAIIPVVLSMKKFRVSVRRWWHDPSILDEDGRAIVDHIQEDLAKLQKEIRAASKRGQGKEIEPLLKLLSSRLAQTQQLVDGGIDDRGSDEVEIDSQGRIRRRVMIRLVRETILANLWAGNYFNESIQRRHEFRTMFDDSSETRVIVVVRTPYYADPFDNQESPYSIRVKYGTRTMMRISWDPENYDDIQVRYCIRGDWEQAILSWNVSQKFVPKIESDLPVQQANPTVTKVASAEVA